MEIQLRPSLNHLINNNNDIQPELSDRSSLSPPPPITLRLGMKNYRPPVARQLPDPTQSQQQHSLDNASYSSSSSSSDEDRDAHSKDSKLLHVPRKIHPPPVIEGFTALLAQHGKSYDWLQPSVASASHPGPPEKVIPKITGWAPIDEVNEIKGKKSHKRRHEGAVGPGKAWRKGLKK